LQRAVGLWIDQAISFFLFSFAAYYLNVVSLVPSMATETRSGTVI